MGIKSLSKFLRTNFSNVFEHVHLSEYAFKKIAIDTSLYLCHYKSIYGEEGWLQAFIKLVACLRKNEIHCVFVYDGGFPQEKRAEQKERADNRSRMDERVFNLENALDKYRDTGEVDPLLVEFQRKRFLNFHSFNGRDNLLNVNAVDNAVKRMRRQLFSITQKDFALTRRLFDVLKVPYFTAPLEAETTCSDLCIQGQVDAVLSEDTDVLAYGTPEFLTKIKTNDETCVRIRYDRVLEEMGISSDQFLDFCIMCGTDYNNNIYRVGPAKALEFICRFGNIEEITEKTVLDTSVLNHKRVRELFRNYDRYTRKINYCGRPDFNELQLFLKTKNINLSVDAIKNSFIRELVVVDSECDSAAKIAPVESALNNPETEAGKIDLAPLQLTETTSA
jgi:5'-3' exonuclease